MSPAKVIPPRQTVFFVSEGQYIGYQPGFENLTKELKQEIERWGPDIFGTRAGFKMNGDMGHGSWSIEVSGRGVKFQPSYIEQQATSGGSGFTVEKNPPAVRLKDGTRIEPVTNKEMMRALNPHRRGRDPER